MALYEATMPDGTVVKIDARRHGLRYATAYFYTGNEAWVNIGANGREFQRPAQPAGWHLMEPRKDEAQAMTEVRRLIRIEQESARPHDGRREQIHLAVLAEVGA